MCLQNIIVYHAPFEQGFKFTKQANIQGVEGVKRLLSMKEGLGMKKKRERSTDSGKALHPLTLTGFSEKRNPT